MKSCIAICVLLLGTASSHADEVLYKGKNLDYWMDMLQSGKTDAEQDLATVALIDFGKDAAPALPKLAKIMEDKSLQHRTRVYRILSAIGPASKYVLPQLIQKLESFADAKELEIDEKLSVLKLISTIGPEASKCVPHLIKLLECPKRVSSYYLIKTLSSVEPNSKEIVERVAQEINRRIDDDDKPYDLIRATQEFGILMTPYFEIWLKYDHLSIQGAVVITIQDMGEKAKGMTKMLEPFLTHESPEARRYAAETLWVLQKNHESLVVYLKHSIAYFGNTDPIAKGVSLDDKSRDLRGSIVKWDIKPAIIRPALEELVKSGSKIEKEIAADTLEKYYKSK